MKVGVVRIGSNPLCNFKTLLTSQLFQSCFRNCIGQLVFYFV